MNNYRENQKARIITVQFAVAAEIAAPVDTKVIREEICAVIRGQCAHLLNTYPYIFFDYRITEDEKAIVKLSGAVEDGDAFLLNDLRIENANRRKKPCANCYNIDENDCCPKCGGCNHSCTC